MTKRILDELEAAVLSRNPQLANKLRPPVAELTIKKRLHDAGLEGAIDSLMELYSWHDGIVTSADTALSKTSLFPNSVYQFLDLESALTHLKEFEHITEFNPTLSSVLGRYVPIFWDDATGYIMLDLAPASRNQIMLMEFESERPLREAYATFSDFISDAIRANKENDCLTCFE